MRKEFYLNGKRLFEEYRAEALLANIQLDDLNRKAREASQSIVLDYPTRKGTLMVKVVM